MGAKFRELQNEMLSTDHDMAGIHPQYVHPGFGNVDNPNVVVFEEAPSLGHFTQFSEDIGSMNISEYVNHFEVEYRTRILGWKLYEDFLGPVFAEFGVGRDSLLDETYTTSMVKNPVKNDNKSSNLRNAYREIWKPYVQRELEILEPDIVITTGYLASPRISSLLGASDASSISISKEQWWGLSPFDARSSLIYTPHWGARKYNSDIKENWEDILDKIVDVLRDSGYSAGVPTQDN